MSNVIIIGAGAAGMMAAYAASAAGHNVTIIEKNEKCGKKIYITGKGRCNLTNNCETGDFFEKVVTNPKFLYSPIYMLAPWQTIELFSDVLKLPVKTERGGRVFPVSDKSSDVIKVLTTALKKYKVNIMLSTAVKDILIENGRVTGVNTDSGIYNSDAVIIAAGGLAYPQTGSTGDGYAFAKNAGHTVAKTYPALVPFNVKEDWPKELMGLSLRNISVAFKKDNKVLYSDFGEMLFTHFGVSGPLILTASSYLTDYIIKGDIDMYIDLKPALSEAELDARIIRDFNESKNVHFSNSLKKLLPHRLIDVVVKLSGIDAYKPVNSVTAKERKKLVDILKNLPVTITGARGYNEAIITRGGVNVNEINPQTMESKLVKNLYFAGEVIDTDAVTGGFNLQIAWSTGYTAGMSIHD